MKVPPQVATAAGGARKQRQPNPLAPVFEFEKHLCVEGKHGHKRRRKARAGAVAAHDEARGGVAKEEVDDGCDGEDACVEPKEGEDAPADAAQGSARSADVCLGACGYSQGAVGCCAKDQIKGLDVGGARRCVEVWNNCSLQRCGDESETDGASRVERRKSNALGGGGTPKVTGKGYLVGD